MDFFSPGVWIKRQCCGSWNMTKTHPKHPAGRSARAVMILHLLYVCEGMLGTVAKAVISAPMSYGGNKHHRHSQQLAAALNLCILLWTGPGHSKGVARANGKKRSQKQVRLSAGRMWLCGALLERLGAWFEFCCENCLSSHNGVTLSAPL